MKKFLSMLLVLVLALSVTAVAFAAEDGKVTIWTWDKTFNIAAMEKAKEMYQAENPDVEVEVVEVLSEDIEARVTASMGDTSTLADIVLVQDNSIMRMVMNYPEVYHDITDV